jgi:hypothetical protein
MIRNHMKNVGLIIGLAGQLALAAPAMAVELVGNGGFETGDFTSWTRFGGLGQSNVNAADAVDGSFGARFSPNSPGGIYQDLATIAGQRYGISFDLQHYANLLEPNNFVTVSFGAIELLNLTNTGSLPLTGYSFSEFADGPVTRLTFTFRDNRDSPANRWSIDNISVEQLTRNGPIPEPEVWGLMLIGLGLVGVMTRRRVALPPVTA